MPDTGTSGISIASYLQYLALQKSFPEVQLDITVKGREIKFKKGTTIIEGTIQVPIPFRNITFYIVPVDTLFLLYI